MDILTILVIVGVIAIIGLKLFYRKQEISQQELAKEFPEQWRQILMKKATFYANLNKTDRKQFEHRVLHFLNTKLIEGVETDIDDTIKLLVAASAIIPSFAFPNYNYPMVRTILIYPGSFNERYQTVSDKQGELPVIGMVDNRSQNGSTIIFSKSALLASFSGIPDRNNVGIHEFVHLLDKEDGEIDGVPEALLERQYVGPWLREIKDQMKEIERGKSDINPYALTNNAEFLAVASEYFFDHPEKFRRKHP